MQLYKSTTKTQLVGLYSTSFIIHQWHTCTVAGNTHSYVNWWHFDGRRSDAVRSGANG